MAAADRTGAVASLLAAGLLAAEADPLAAVAGHLEEAVAGEPGRREAGSAGEAAGYSQ